MKTPLFSPSDTHFPLNPNQHRHGNVLPALSQIPYEINGVSGVLQGQGRRPHAAGLPGGWLRTG